MFSRIETIPAVADSHPASQPRCRSKYAIYAYASRSNSNSNNQIFIAPYASYRGADNIGKQVFVSEVVILTN